MGIILTIVGANIPRFIKKRMIIRLFVATADAFEASMPSVEKLTTEECLREYAFFTKDRAEATIRTGNEVQVKQKLYANAFRLGTGIREELGVRGVKETMQLAQLVYRVVGIDFNGMPDGEVVITRCFFSRFYSPAVCGIIQSLDAGLLSGISGGGRLSFSERLTTGSECCRARLSMRVKVK